MNPPFKVPESVLVVIHTAAAQVLLLERADLVGGWQSVTGSKDHSDEPWTQAAAREVFEETGIDAYAPGCALSDWQLENQYPIYEHWRHRYAPGTTHNTERVFGLRVPDEQTIRLSPREHLAYQWLGADHAAAMCFSPSNARAIRRLLGSCLV